MTIKSKPGELRAKLPYDVDIDTSYVANNQSQPVIPDLSEEEDDRPINLDSGYKSNFMRLNRHKRSR